MGAVFPSGPLRVEAGWGPRGPAWRGGACPREGTACHPWPVRAVTGGLRAPEGAPGPRTEERAELLGMCKLGARGGPLAPLADSESGPGRVPGQSPPDPPGRSVSTLSLPFYPRRPGNPGIQSPAPPAAAVFSSGSLGPSHWAAAGRGGALAGHSP